MIDVIIPAYNAHNTIERTLFSIAYQENIKDLKVYIVNDNSEIDYSKEVSFFGQFMDIAELTLYKNGGPGVARQYGIDHSNSEYIIFIDSDDVFYSPIAIKTLYDNIVEDYDVVISSFYEELENGEFAEHIDDTIWLHGKIYRRNFLIDNNIKFNSTYANEDNGFNQLIFLHDSNVKTIDDFTYLWLFNKDSITRKNNCRYRYSSLTGYIYNMSWALNKAIQDSCNKNKIASFVFLTLVAVYYYYIEFIDEKGVEELLIQSKRLREIYLEYSIEQQEREKLFYNQFEYFSRDMSELKMLNPPLTLEQFLNLIERC